MPVDYSFILLNVRLFVLDTLSETVRRVSTDLDLQRYGLLGTRCLRQSWRTGFCWSGSVRRAGRRL